VKLLVDIGNTRLKWACWDGAHLHAGSSIAHGENVDFAALFADAPRPVDLWVASVAAPAMDAALAQFARERWQREPHFVRSSANACGVRNAYAQPERLGIDRFLGLIAVHAAQPGAAVIAGCGTALTLDALAADGTHLGGLIAPAPELMRSALLGNTARLGNLPPAEVVEIATDTAAAVMSGSWLAAAALLERFAAQAAQRLGATPALILGGGGAGALSELIALPHRIDAALVLRGLAIYADDEMS
jgi:type III pantothenate kinase